MFDLKDGDLKIAKVLWNIAIPLFLAAPVAFFAGIEFPFGFFNLFMSVATYYALKLCTDAEKSLMTPFYLFFLASGVLDAFAQGNTIAYGTEYDIYSPGSHIMFMMFLLSSYWGFKSLIPNWARIAVLIAGISQIVASYASLIDDTALHDIADTGAFLMLFFLFAVRNAVVDAAKGS